MTAALLEGGSDERGITMKLEGKIVAITGGAQGIGAAIARRVFEAGARVAVLDIDATKAASMAKECSAPGRAALAVACDVSERANVFEAVERVVKECGGLHVMIANAGIAQVRPFMELTEADWDRMLAINVKGVVFSFQAAAKHMIESKTKGRLIAASSIAGHQGYALLAHYCASKFSVRAVVQACAKEFAPYGINVNAYCPGIVDTSMWGAMDRHLSQMTGAAPGEMLKKYARMALLKRPETPEDIAGLVAFLASDDAAAINGQALIVDGGIVFV
jgi:meso-butanediol dehydrogenase/(S,S)-butanediol dehydrogenase/diacetyl reductase